MSDSEYRLMTPEPGSTPESPPEIVTHPLGLGYQRVPEEKKKQYHLREIFWASLPAVVLLTAIGVWSSASRPPQFYRAAISSTLPPEQRTALAQDLEKQAQDWNKAPTPVTGDLWDLGISQLKLNSWLTERFAPLKGDWNRIGLRDPRVQINANSLQAGFWIQRAGKQEFWSFDVLPSIVPPRQITLKILNVHLGLIPIPKSNLKLSTAGVIHGEDWEMNWTFSPETETLTLDLPEKLNFPPLEKVILAPESIRVQGRIPSDRVEAARDVGSATDPLQTDPQPMSSPPTAAGEGSPEEKPAEEKPSNEPQPPPVELPSP